MVIGIALFKLDLVVVIDFVVGIKLLELVGSLFDGMLIVIKGGM